MDLEGEDAIKTHFAFILTMAEREGEEKQLVVHPSPLVVPMSFWFNPDPNQPVLGYCWTSQGLTMFQRNWFEKDDELKIRTDEGWQPVDPNDPPQFHLTKWKPETYCNRLEDSDPSKD